MVRTKELRGHTSRVLHMATSPDGSLVCSGAADETLRFWNIFASEVGVGRHVGVHLNHAHLVSRVVSLQGKRGKDTTAGPSAGLGRTAGSSLRIR